MPLLQLSNLCKGNYSKWNAEHHTAFETLKSALFTKPVLRANTAAG